MYRNKTLTQSARDENCACCGADDTVVWAHSNKYRHGKGRGIKAHDIFGAYLCYRCHTQFDCGNIPDACTWYCAGIDDFFVQVWERSIIIAASKGYL